MVLRTARARPTRCVSATLPRVLRCWMCAQGSASGTGPRFCAGCFLMPCRSPEDHGTCDGLPLTPWLLRCSRVQVSCDSSSGSRSRTASPKPLPRERDAGSDEDGKAASKLHTGAPHEQGGAGMFALPVPCAEDVLYEVLVCCPCSLQEETALSMLPACSCRKANRRLSFLVCVQAKMISRAGVETRRHARIPYAHKNSRARACESGVAAQEAVVGNSVEREICHADCRRPLHHQSQRRGQFTSFWTRFPHVAREVT